MSGTTSGTEAARAAEPDYSRYEFKWEPKTIRIYWELNERLNGPPEGIDRKPAARNVTYGHAFTLDGARRKAHAAMQVDEETQRGGRTDIVQRESGEQLHRKIVAADLADRHV